MNSILKSKQSLGLFLLVCGIMLFTSCTNANVELAKSGIAAATTATFMPQLSLSATLTPVPLSPTPLDITLTPLFDFVFPTATATPTVMPTLTSTPLPPCTEPGHLTDGVVTSTLTKGGDMAYRIYLPPCYGRDGRNYPTLYMIAGNNQAAGIWDYLGLDEAAEEAVLKGEIPPYIIVMVSSGLLALTTNGGPGSYEQFFMDELIPTIEADYCAWPDSTGRALGGLSRGGYWSLEIAFRHPEEFAGVGGHSSSLYDYSAEPDVNPQFTGVNNELGELRVYMDIGEQDIGIYNTRKLHEDMETAGVAHEWVLNPGLHDHPYWRTHVSDYVAWYGSLWSHDRGAYPLCDKPAPDDFQK